MAKILLSVGLVAASVGFTFLGIATSTREVHQDARDLGIILMAAGGGAAVIGLFWYREEERRHG
jgi:uncharacterized membrane protein YidH (DUF202 family)